MMKQGKMMMVMCMLLQAACNGVIEQPDLPAGKDMAAVYWAETCNHGYYQCYSSMCITADWVCDGWNDCESGEDEQDCWGSTQCGSDQFGCDEGWKCDVLADCVDGTDEQGCDSTSVFNWNSKVPDARHTSIGLWVSIHDNDIVFDHYNNWNGVDQYRSEDIDDKDIHDGGVAFYPGGGMRCSLWSHRPGPVIGGPWQVIGTQSTADEVSDFVQLFIESNDQGFFAITCVLIYPNPPDLRITFADIERVLRPYVLLSQYPQD